MTRKAGRISDFSSIADRYDQTRHIPENILIGCYKFLQEHNFIPSEGMVLDAGCGTGQISIPLLKFGFNVIGIDVSLSMIERAKTKTNFYKHYNYQVGDVRAIAHSNSFFDLIVFSKLLMHIEDWKTVCEEFIRVAKPGFPIVQIHDRGFFANSVRKEFSRRADSLGFINRFPGTDNALGEVSRYMSSLGCSIYTFRPKSLSWDRCITRHEALRDFEGRLFAEFWYLPDEIYEQILAETHAWALNQPGGLDRVERLHPYLFIEVYQTHNVE